MGVDQHSSGRWRARLQVDRKTYALGYYETRAEAEEVVRKARETIKPKPKIVKRPEGLLLDPEDNERFSEVSMFLDNKGYCRFSSGENRNKKVHRLVMNAPSDKQVDHINCNKLDNRKCNLRLCSNQENAFNRRKHYNNKSGLKGAYRDGKRWRSQIYLDGKHIHLGGYDTPEEAHQAYCDASKKYHGDFGRTD